MGFFESRKLVLFLFVTSLVFSFSGKAEAWSWSLSWGSDHSDSHSDNSGGSSWSSSGSKSDGSSWGFGWGSSSGPSGTGSTHNRHQNHMTPSNHSSSTGSTHHNNTAPSNHSSSAGLPSNSHQNHTAPSSNSTGFGSIPKNHTIPSNHSSGSVSTHNNYTIPSSHSSSAGSTRNNYYDHTAPVWPRRKIEVTVWRNGFDYQQWLSKHGPFYVNDVLVFKYNKDQKQKNKNNDVYLLRDLRSYKICDVNRGKKLAARESSSSRGGFKLLIRTTQPYYFASGDYNNCNNRNMKFSLSPIPH